MDEPTSAIDAVVATLAPNLAQSVDQYSMYASTSVPGADEFEWLDVLIQTADSQLPLGLWFGDGFPMSPGDDGFAPEATVEADSGGNILAWLEQVRDDADGEPDEIVRILAAYRADGCVVTVNRYADGEADQHAEPWEFESLRQLALEPRWRSAVEVHPDLT